jgi:hypothetical protein
MRGFLVGVMALVAPVLAGGPTQAATVYYNLFNIEGESDVSASFVTYATLADMLNDENRTSVVDPDGSVLAAANVVGSGADGTTFWNLFNIEGESTISAGFATYSAFEDMLNDENRTGVFFPDGSVLAAPNVVGTGSDGTTYWNLFNIEGESSISAGFVTYATLADMLNDENRTGTFFPDGTALAAPNVVGTGSDGTTYWNLFNIEGESAVGVGFVTYASLFDMLNDENRTGTFLPSGSILNGRNNIVGTGAFHVPDEPPPVVPLPASAWLMVAGLGALVAARGRPRHGQPRRDRR